MDEDQRDLLNRLFALMTAMFEDAAALAADGQSPRLSAALLAGKGHTLLHAAHDIAAIAEAAAFVAERAGNNSHE